MIKLTREGELFLINKGLEALLNEAQGPEIKQDVKLILYGDWDTKPAKSKKTKKSAAKKVVRRRKRRMTAAGRKRISEMMKKRWVEAKKKNKTSLG